jgi:hypothetical protein
VSAVQAEPLTAPGLKTRTRVSPQVRFWSTPIAWWSAAGGLILAFEAYVFIAWIASDDFHRIKPGPTPVPGWMQVALVACCISTLGLALYLAHRWIYKPWRISGALTTLGAFGLATPLMVWHDPLQNQTIPWFSYNHWLPNMGAWGNEVPLINQVHNAALADPLYASIPGFMLLYFGGAVLGCWAMNKAKERWPGIGTPQLVMLTIGLCTAVMGVLELAWMRTGFYIYPNTIGGLTLFKGQYFQIPVYEFLIDGVTVAAMSWVVYFRNDKGETIVERGLTDLTVSTWKKNLMRISAFVVIINLVFGAYDLVVQPFIHAGDGVPKVMQERSYFMGGYCGEGSSYACWSKDLPVPTPGSAHVAPDGRLVPGENPIPQLVPFKRTR